MTKGFTLIEVLIIVAVLAILSEYDFGRDPVHHLLEDEEDEEET